MISFELAKKLKDAGFPLRSTFGADLDMFSDEFSFRISDDTYIRPFLSELIEACGASFDTLGQRSGSVPPEYKRWVARGLQKGKKIGFEQIKEEGQTPEEAVSNLYLAINK